MTLRWCLFLHCFTLKVFWAIPYTLILPFVQFTKPLHCSISIYFTFALQTFLSSFSRHVLCLPIFLLISISDAYTLLVTRSPPVRSACPNHFEAFRSTQSLTFSLAPSLHLMLSVLLLSSLITPHVLL